MTTSASDSSAPAGTEAGRHRGASGHRSSGRHRSAPEPGTEAAGTEAPTGTDAAAAGGDSECGNATSDVVDGDLEGFAGTTPFGKITPEFIGRLCEIDPSLTDLNYATETYDAVMISALAVLQAGDDGIAHGVGDQQRHPRR